MAIRQVKEELELPPAHLYLEDIESLVAMMTVAAIVMIVMYPHFVSQWAVSGNATALKIYRKWVGNGGTLKSKLVM